MQSYISMGAFMVLFTDIFVVHNMEAIWFWVMLLLLFVFLEVLISNNHVRDIDIGIRPVSIPQIHWKTWRNPTIEFSNMHHIRYPHWSPSNIGFEFPSLMSIHLEVTFSAHDLGLMGRHASHAKPTSRVHHLMCRNCMCCSLEIYGYHYHMALICSHGLCLLQIEPVILFDFNNETQSLCV